MFFRSNPIMENGFYLDNRREDIYYLVKLNGQKGIFEDCNGKKHRLSLDMVRGQKYTFIRDPEVYAQVLKNRNGQGTLVDKIIINWIDDKLTG